LLNKNLLHYYQQELRYLQQQGEKFAKVHPKVAGHLGLTAGDQVDPLVERLLQGVAFLTARINQQMDGDYPEITRNVLNVLYPQALLPVPAMSMVQFVPHRRLTKSYTVAAHSELKNLTQLGAPYVFRTAYQTTVWPLQVSDVQLGQSSSLLPQYQQRDIRSCLQVTLQACGNQNIGKLSLSSLRFYINLDLPQALLLHEHLFNQLDHMLLEIDDGDRQKIIACPALKLVPVGFTDDQSCLAYPQHSSRADRLLTEYFVLPEKFCFFDLMGLDQMIEGLAQHSIRLHFFLRCPAGVLSEVINKKSLLLSCTPVVNLFSQSARPIRLDQQQYRYPLVADQQAAVMPADVYQVSQLSAQTAKAAQAIVCAPLFGAKAHNDQECCLCWTLEQQAVLDSHGQMGQGYDSFLVFNDHQLDWQVSQGAIIQATLLCTNRPLSQQLSCGDQAGTWQLTLPVDGVVDAVLGLRSITTAHYRDQQHSGLIDLIAQLSLNQWSLSDLHQAKPLMSQWLQWAAERSGQVADWISKGLLAVSAEQVCARHPRSLRYGFCQGLAVKLVIDEPVLPANSAYLLGAVLEQCLADIASINTFTQLTVINQQQQEIAKWPPRMGIKTPL